MQILEKKLYQLALKKNDQKFYVGHNVKLRLDQAGGKSVKIGRRMRKGCILSPILFNLCSDYFIKGALGFGDLKITGQIFRFV